MGKSFPCHLYMDLTDGETEPSRLTEEWTFCFAFGFHLAQWGIMGHRLGVLVL